MKPDNTKRGIPAQTMIRLPDVIKRVGLGKIGRASCRERVSSPV